MYGHRPYSSLPYSALGGAEPETPAFPPPFPPNPTLPARRSVTLLTWTDSFKLPLQQDLPPRQTDWPVPRGPVPASILNTWTDSFKLPLQQTLPFNQFDWPVPRGPTTNEGRTFFSLIQPPAPEKPASQDDWPVPKGPEYPLALRTWIDTFQPHTPPEPPALDQRAYPRDNPRGRPFPVALRTHTHNNVRYFGKDTFFGLAGHPNFDWPNPVRRRPDVNIRLLTVAGSKPQYPPTVQVAGQTLARLELRVRFLENETRRVRFLPKTVIR